MRGIMFALVAAGLMAGPARASVTELSDLETVSGVVEGVPFVQLDVPAEAVTGDVAFAALSFDSDAPNGTEIEMWVDVSGDGEPWAAEGAEADRVFWTMDTERTGTLVRFDITGIFRAAGGSAVPAILFRAADGSEVASEAPGVTIVSHGR